MRRTGILARTANRLRIPVFVISTVLIFAQGSVALSGADTDASDFQATMTLWLQDNEDVALPELARLTRNGNEQALLLLAMIDKTIELQGPWLALLSRSDRKTLMRAPGGISGKSWLKTLPKSIFAKNWLDVLSVKSDVQTALIFAEIGEHRAARQSLMFLEARQGSGFASISQDPGYPREMLYLVWRQWRFEGGKDAQIRAGLAQLHPGDQQRRMMGQRPAVAATEDWLATAETALPLRSLCQSLCLASVNSCSRSALRAVGGYQRLMTFGSPVAALISDAEFATSQRAHMTIIRAALLATQLTPRRLNQIASIDACFASAVDDEAQNF